MVVRFVTATASVMTGSPLISSEPAVGGLIRPMMVSSVDLPEPDGPTIATTSPARASNVVGRSASTRVGPSP